MTNNPFTKNQSCISRFFLFMSLTCVSLVSCESDKDENADAPKRLTEMTYQETSLDDDRKDGDESCVLQLLYDSEGRVIKEISNSQSDRRNTKTECTYQYGEKFIVLQVIKEEERTGGTTRLEIERHKYVLENGLIVSDTVRDGSSVDIWSYSYDDEKRIKLATYKPSSRTYEFNYVWEDGNIMKIQTKGDTCNYTYTTLPWKKGLAVSFGTYLDAFLWDAGYFGKRPLNLPAEFTEKEGHYTMRCSYEYTVTDGLITKLKEDFSDNDSGQRTTVATMKWE